MATRKTAEPWGVKIERQIEALAPLFDNGSVRLYNDKDTRHDIAWNIAMNMWSLLERKDMPFIVQISSMSSLIGAVLLLDKSFIRLTEKQLQAVEAVIDIYH